MAPSYACPKQRPDNSFYTCAGLLPPAPSGQTSEPSKEASESRDIALGGQRAACPVSLASVPGKELCVCGQIP